MIKKLRKKFILLALAVVAAVIVIIVAGIDVANYLDMKSDADETIAEGDLVWIKDIKNGAPLAIGKALRSGTELKQKAGGKAIKTIHFVGDKLWKTGE